MTNRLSEIQIIPIKPQNGLVAFASFVLDSNLYLGSIGIMTRSNGGLLRISMRKNEKSIGQNRKKLQRKLAN